jgi:uncharacterized membrane protein YbhN (UPF0104 family)
MRRHLTRFLPFAGLLVVVPAVWVLMGYAREIDASGVLRHLNEYSLPQILAAIGFSLTALALCGLFEARALREAGRPLGVLRPMVVAAISSPIGHSVGLATLSGGALRYRFYSPLGLSHTAVATVIFYAALPYVLGLGLLLELAFIFGAERAAPLLHLPTWAVVAIGVLGLGKDVAYVLFTAFRRTPIGIGRFVFRLPSLKFTLLQYGIGSIEIICFASVLYLFLPAAVNLAFPTFLAVFVLSVIAGSISNVPAGLGVFEAAMLLMLREFPSEPVIAAIVAYRVVYEVLQLLVALGLLALYEFGSRHGFAGRLWRNPHR